MTAKYVKHVTKSDKTPQIEKAKDNQVQGRAGGFVFEVNDWTKLVRFLVIGNEGGTYYASERELTIENYDVVRRCLNSDGKRTVNTIVEFSDSGRGVKNDPAVFALAVCSVFGDKRTRTYANQAMPKVARYSTDLFSWVDTVVALKEGRKAKGLLRAIGRWYVDKNARQVAYQICKYPGRIVNNKQRWTHADLLRICKIAPAKNNRPARNGRALTIPSKNHSLVFHYATHGAEKTKDFDIESLTKTDLKYLWAHNKCKNSTSIKEIVKLIKDYNLTRESVEPNLRNDIEVQKALLPKMPMTAMIRNLGGMTSSDLLKPLCDETSLVIETINNEKNLKKGRIHPMAIMLALKTYAKGQGKRSTWNPVSTIKDALEEAFYKAFNYVEPTNKKFLLGIDVSGSMASWGWSSYGKDKSTPVLTPREAAAVVAMTIARTEKNYEMMAFSSQFVPLKITAKDSLDTVIRRTSNLPFMRTDCSLPMVYAMEKGLDVDVFVVLTDSETYYGNIHPFEAIKQYRKKYNKDAKLAVLAFTANRFTIADPDDVGMIDIAGLDASVPKVLAEFSAGNI